MLTQQSKSTAILVFTYDGYKDLWPVFIELINKNWRNNPYKIYFTYYENVIETPDITFLKLDKDLSWTQRLTSALQLINEDNVLLLLEDFLITKPINTEIINNTFSYIYHNKILYYKFYMPPFSKKVKKNLKVDGSCYYIDENVRYGVSLQPAVWNKDFLIKTLQHIKMNAWEFEHFLNRTDLISEKNKGQFIFDKRNQLNLVHALVRGKLSRKAYKVIKDQCSKDIVLTRGRHGILTELFFKVKRILRELIPGVTKKRK